jgi:hypothetical protein
MSPASRISSSPAVALPPCSSTPLRSPRPSPRPRTRPASAPAPLLGLLCVQLKASNFCCLRMGISVWLHVNCLTKFLLEMLLRCFASQTQTLICGCSYSFSGVVRWCGGAPVDVAVIRCCDHVHMVVLPEVAQMFFEFLTAKPSAPLSTHPSSTSNRRPSRQVRHQPPKPKTASSPSRIQGPRPRFMFFLSEPESGEPLCSDTVRLRP